MKISRGGRSESYADFVQNDETSREFPDLPGASERRHSRVLSPVDDSERWGVMFGWNWNSPKIQRETLQAGG